MIPNSLTLEGLRSPGSFAPEVTMAMGLAFDRAWRMIEVSHHSILDEYGTIPSRELLASEIVELARDGERNPDRLRDRALAALLPPKS